MRITFLLVCVLFIAGVQGVGYGQQLTPARRDSTTVLVNPRGFSPVHIPVRYHCGATRIGQYMFYGADLFLAGAGYAYATDNSPNRSNQSNAAALLSMGLTMGLNGAIFWGCGRWHENRVLRNKDNQSYMEPFRLDGEDYLAYFGPVKNHCGATKVGEGMMILGGTCLMSSGVMAMMSDHNSIGFSDAEAAFVGLGLVACYYGSIVYGSGKVYDALRKQKRFSLIGTQHTLGFGYVLAR